jgi:hypothetical protein
MLPGWKVAPRRGQKTLAISNTVSEAIRSSKKLTNAFLEVSLFHATFLMLDVTFVTGSSGSEVRKLLFGLRLRQGSAERTWACASRFAARESGTAAVPDPTTAR